MRRATVVLILFVLVVAGIVGVSQWLRNQPPLEIEVAVDPLAAVWVKDAVARLNATNPVVNATRRVQFKVTEVSDMDVWRGEVKWRVGWREGDNAAEKPPHAWLPSSSVSVTYTLDGSSLPLATVTPSLARTLLVWGGYASRVAVVTQEGTVPLDWPAVTQAAKAESWKALGGDENWQFVKLGFALPDRTMTGLAVLFSGAAAYHQTADLNGDATRGSDFYDWLQPVIASVPSFQTLGSDVAKPFSRGPSTVEIALLPENQWLLNLDAMTANEPVRLNYPAYTFVFDFPLVAWNEAPTLDDARAAVNLLGGWLLEEEQQAELVNYGLRPVKAEPPQTATLFAAGAQYGIQLTPNYGQTIQAPPRADAQGLIQWFASIQRR